MLTLPFQIMSIPWYISKACKVKKNIHTFWMDVKVGTGQVAPHRHCSPGLVLCICYISTCLFGNQRPFMTRSALIVDISSHRWHGSLKARYFKSWLNMIKLLSDFYPFRTKIKTYIKNIQQLFAQAARVLPQQVQSIFLSWTPRGLFSSSSLKASVLPPSCHMPILLTFKLNIL